MRRVIFYFSLIMAMAACEPRVDLDESQWDMTAEITDMFIYQMQQNEITLADGTKVMGTKKVTVSSDYEVDSEAATVTITLKPDTDRSNVSCYIYYTGNGITPLEGAPKPGVMDDWSKDTYKYRVTTAGSLFKDWTIIIE